MTQVTNSPTATAGHTPNAKLVHLVAAGTDGATWEDVWLEPGTKAIDIITGKGMRGQAISKPGTAGGIFAPDDDVYVAVQSGQKLYATPDDVAAGAS